MKQETKTQQAQRPVQAPTGTGQKRKKTPEDYKRESEQNRKRWMPLVRYMKKHGIKFKTARCGKFRIEYFRTDELEDLIEKNKDQLEKESSFNDLIRSWNKEVVYFVRPENFPKLKYPKQLDKSQGNAVSKFASFKFDTAEPKTWLFPTILLGIIAVVLFPLWPYALKYTVFMICLVLVIAILSLIVVRLVVYLIFAIFGVSFWILPNFFADCTIAESFMPVYSVAKWQSGMFSIVGRLLAFSIVAYYGYHAYVDPSWIYENIEITKTSMDDLHDWGVSKIKGEKNFSQSALTDRSVDAIINQTAEAHVEDTHNDNIDLSEQQDEHEQNLEGQQALDTQQNDNESEVGEGDNSNDQQNGSGQL